jgi:16S rRNA (cytidine1402-2'-O)-methyltransferase
MQNEESTAGGMAAGSGPEAGAGPPPLRAGTLYLVATPIGNLEDMTLRGLRVLKECDVVAAEDTRHTGLLLKHFGIAKPMLSYFRFNEAARSREIVERLQRGAKIALVTDAGTPGISDPGERVVKAALAGGCRVEPVPGPCALAAALSASGLPADEFHFVGFLAHKSGRRRRQLEAVKGGSGHAGFVRITASDREAAGGTGRVVSGEESGAGAGVDQKI